MEFNNKDKTECLNGGTQCTPSNVIKEIAKELNNNAIDNKPLVQSIDKELKNDKHQTNGELTKLKDTLNCESESCVINSEEVKNAIGEDKSEEILERYFKPEGPRNNDNLLNNFNIDDVLESWKRDHPGFYHVFYQMIDFDIVKTELATLDIVTISKSYDSLGVVLNTDVSTGGGIHWFALYCDFKTKPLQLEYFNSSGNLPRKEVQIWLARNKRTLLDAGMQCEVINAARIAHQQDSETECGPYSLYYIKSRLNGVPAEQFNKKRIPDAKMLEFRQTLFRHE